MKTAVIVQASATVEGFSLAAGDNISVIACPDHPLHGPSGFTAAECVMIAEAIWQIGEKNVPICNQAASRLLERYYDAGMLVRNTDPENERFFAYTEGGWINLSAKAFNLGELMNTLAHEASHTFDPPYKDPSTIINTQRIPEQSPAPYDDWASWVGESCDGVI